MGEIANAMVDAFMNGARDDEEAMEMAFGYGALCDFGDDDPFDFRFQLVCEGVEVDEDDDWNLGETELDCWDLAILHEKVEIKDGALHLLPGWSIVPLEASPA